MNTLFNKIMFGCIIAVLGYLSYAVFETREKIVAVVETQALNKESVDLNNNNIKWLFLQKSKR